MLINVQSSLMGKKAIRMSEKFIINYTYTMYRNITEIIIWKSGFLSGIENGGHEWLKRDFNKWQHHSWKSFKTLNEKFIKIQ